MCTGASKIPFRFESLRVTALIRGEERANSRQTYCEFATNTQRIGSECTVSHYKFTVNSRPDLTAIHSDSLRTARRELDVNSKRLFVMVRPTQMWRPQLPHVTFEFYCVTVVTHTDSCSSMCWRKVVALTEDGHVSSYVDRRILSASWAGARRQ